MKGRCRPSTILEETATLLENGTLRHTMKGNAGPLNAENLRQAHARLESGSMIGKLALTGYDPK